MCYPLLKYIVLNRFALSAKLSISWCSRNFFCSWIQISNPVYVKLWLEIIQNILWEHLSYQVIKGFPHASYLVVQNTCTHVGLFVTEHHLKVQLVFSAKNANAVPLPHQLKWDIWVNAWQNWLFLPNSTVLTQGPVAQSTWAHIIPMLQEHPFCHSRNLSIHSNAPSAACFSNQKFLISIWNFFFHIIIVFFHKRAVNNI